MQLAACEFLNYQTDFESVWYDKRDVEKKGSVWPRDIKKATQFSDVGCPCSMPHQKWSLQVPMSCFGGEGCAKQANLDLNTARMVLMRSRVEARIEVHDRCVQ